MKDVAHGGASLFKVSPNSTVLVLPFLVLSGSYFKLLQGWTGNTVREQ
jgi:hypothetical protein